MLTKRRDSSIYMVKSSPSVRSLEPSVHGGPITHNETAYIHVTSLIKWELDLVGWKYI